MSYYSSRRPNPKSTWKRPKAKMYACNSQEMEKFYQNNYNDYLTLKNEYRTRQQERDARGDAEALTQRFQQRRASSLVYGEDDTPRTHRLIPNRQTSNDGSSSQSYTRSRVERSEFNSDSGLSDSLRSTSSATRNVSFSTSLNANDSNNEMASIETRLERLRKLREELGLPSENTGGGATSSATNSSSYTSTTQVSSSRGNSPPTETRGRDRWTRQGSTARSDSRTRASPARQEATYTTKTERSSLRNGLDDGGSSYSTKSTRFHSGDSSAMNGLSSSMESSFGSSTRTRKRVEKPSLDGIDMDFDDDALLADMKKKIPSSSEILDRIKNMDIE